MNHNQICKVVEREAAEQQYDHFSKLLLIIKIINEDHAKILFYNDTVYQQIICLKTIHFLFSRRKHQILLIIKTHLPFIKII